MTTTTPSLPHDDDWSGSTLRLLVSLVCNWETLYHAIRFSLKVVLDRRPERILDHSLLDRDDKGERGTNDNDNGQNNDCERSLPLEDARRTLLQRGPSYAVSLIHSVYVTGRGALHLCDLWRASSIQKMWMANKEAMCPFRQIHIQVDSTNTLFLSYLLYDLFHILVQYPKLGGVDTIIHHILFASCSIINGKYSIMPFPFAWLIVGELSTIFLNTRWFLLKFGRGAGAGGGGGPALIDRVNMLFAVTFFLTRVVIYSAGVVDMFWFGVEALRSLPDRSGVPVPLLLMTCGCVLLGWALNILWGYKILGMVRGKSRKKRKEI